MKFITKRHVLTRLLTAGLLALLGLFAAHAADNDYPNKPVNIIVAYAPGGQGDVFARLVRKRR